MRAPDHRFDPDDQAACMRLRPVTAPTIPACSRQSDGARFIGTPRAGGLLLDCRPVRACQTDRLRSQISPFGPLDVPTGPTSQPGDGHDRMMPTRIY